MAGSDDDATRESYDEVADEYVRRIADELAQKPLDRHLLNRFAESLRGQGLVADVGCGPGHVARYLHDQGVEMVGIDLSPVMIRHARDRNPDLDFQVGDMRALELSDSALAGIVAFYSLIHIAPAEHPSTLRELRRVLRPGGLLLLGFHVGTEVLHVEELWERKVQLDFRFFVPGEIAGRLEEAGFRVLEWIEREPYEGAEHASRRCYLLARKRE
jgi:SAM-dependent methyltransferase